MKDRILKVLRETFEDETLNTSCSQQNCDKWDSLHHLNLVLELEEEFEIDLDPKEIAQMKSFEDILRIMEGK